MFGYFDLLKLVLLAVLASRALGLTITCIVSPVWYTCFTENGGTAKCELPIMSDERFGLPTIVLSVEGNDPSRLTVRSGYRIWEEAENSSSCGVGKMKSEKVKIKGDNHYCSLRGAEIRRDQVFYSLTPDGGFLDSPFC
ncbi:hypothetical protein FGB62_134g09 [Gracilaria domingensis]|nr:hypothetical protein FGB62_134g09 [Gracilaria domingensis]